MSKRTKAPTRCHRDWCDDIGKIATGEIEDATDATKSAAAQLGSWGGKKRAENMTPERRSEIAKAAATKRWGNST